MEPAVSFPSAPVIVAETRSPTLTPPMPATLPVTLVARVTAAVTTLPPEPMVIEVGLTAVTGPPTSSRRVAPAGSEGTPPACGASPGPPDGRTAEPYGLGAAVLGEELAAAGLPVTSLTATAATPNPAAAATTAVSAN